MKEICKKNDCCGCMACLNRCPKNAIKCIENELYPIIEEKKCVDCGICRKICEKSIKPKRTLEYIAAKMKQKEERNNSASGGFFYVLAKYVLNNNGVVYGASYDNDFMVKHIKVDNLADLEKLRKSKYVQSQIGQSYKMAETDLCEGRLVLFSGTPCQIAGLYKYLKKDYDNLLTMDLICHGVPKNKYYKDYLEFLEIKNNSKIANIDFRYKNGLSTSNILVNFKNGTKYFGDDKQDLFRRLYLKNLILRSSCYSCKYSTINRISNFTAGDCWRIDEIKPSFNQKDGVSLVLINDKKAQNIWNLIKQEFDVLSITKENCIQSGLKGPGRTMENLKRFERIYNKCGFEKTALKYKKTKISTKIIFKIKKIGLDVYGRIKN